MKKILTVILIFYLTNFLGQVLNNSSSYFLDSANKLLLFQGEGNYGATQLPLSFVNILYRGGTIDSSMKEIARSRGNDLNRGGFEANINLIYYNFNTDLFKKLGYYIGFKTHHSAGLEYTEDLFESVFYGNTSFKNDSIKLQRTGLHSRHYNSFYAGIIKQNFKIGIGYTSIQSEMSGIIQQGYIYTAPHGTFMTVDIDGQFRSTSTNPGYFSQAGWGIGLNFEYTSKLNVLDSNSNTRIFAGVNNFGIKMLNKNTELYIVDTNFIYQGVNIQSLNDFSQSLLANDMSDSTFKSDNEKYIGMLPFEIYIYKVGGKINAKLHSTYGIRFRSQSNYSTFIFAGLDFHINNKFTIGGLLSYGGYSKFQIGSYFRVRSRSLGLGLNTNNLLGLFWNKSNGSGIGLSLSYIIK